jgi:hypothetical protein
MYVPFNFILLKPGWVKKWEAIAPIKNKLFIIRARIQISAPIEIYFVF